MRGDIYAQDKLLSEVNQIEKKGVGADIRLNGWNADRGTWDDVEIVQPGQPSIPINVFGGYKDEFPEVSNTASIIRKDVNRSDLNKFLKDAQDAYGNGTLADALEDMGAQISVTHTDASKTATGQTVDQYTAIVNNSAGNVTFNLAVVDVANADGKRITTFNATKTACSCSVAN
jgi:hypothetical protein